MVSFDVVSFFTNVPIAMAIEVVNRRLVEDDRWTQAAGALSSMDLCDMLSACLSSTYFVFGEVYYKQVFGTAMDSPVLAVIANAVMEDLEECTITSLPVQPSV